MTESSREAHPFLGPTTLDFTVAALTSNQGHTAERAPRCHLSAVEVGSGQSHWPRSQMDCLAQGLGAETLPYLPQLPYLPSATISSAVAWHLAFLSPWPPFSDHTSPLSKSTRMTQNHLHYKALNLFSSTKLLCCPCRGFITGRGVRCGHL